MSFLGVESSLTGRRWVGPSSETDRLAEALMQSAALPRPILRSGGALPDAAVTALCEMLAFSDPLAPYAGVAQVRAACTPESLDAFAVALFQSWIAAGAKATGEWALQALALIGGDHAARDLTRQIRAWGQAGLKRSKWDKGTSP